MWMRVMPNGWEDVENVESVENIEKKMNYINDENDDLWLGGGVGSDWDCNHAGDGSHTCSDTPVATSLVTVIKMTEGNHFFKG